MAGKAMCRSTDERPDLSFLAIDGMAELRTSGGDLDAAARKQVIEAVRAGKHVELSVQAITFRQRDGSPNKNFLRFKTEKLGAIADSFVGKPMLLDHNKWEQTARMGTIIASELVHLGNGWAGFRQTFRVVKPHAVISVMDGTLDAFSIGWDPSFPVHCTVHETSVRAKDRCGCWPGDRVDGSTVEYEWQSTEGIETSAVNSPAVSGTRIEDARSALAAELSITDDEISWSGGTNLDAAAEQLGLDPEELAQYAGHSASRGGRNARPATSARRGTVSISGGGAIGAMWRQYHGIVDDDDTDDELEE